MNNSGRRRWLVPVFVLIIGTGLLIGLLYGVSTTAGAESANGTPYSWPDAFVEPGPSTDTDLTASTHREVESVQAVLRFENQTTEPLTSAASDREPLGLPADETRGTLEDRPNESSPITVEQRFWIANAALVTVDPRSISLEDLESIDGVSRVHPNHEVVTMESVSASAGASDTSITNPAASVDFYQETHSLSSSSIGDTTYGIDQINAPSVWEVYETMGDGSRVAVLDTGIDADHPDVDLYTEDETDPTYPGGWAEFDGFGNQISGSVPSDSDGHGTHVSGTIVGGDGSATHVGVAPEATLLHGKVFDDGTATYAQLLGGLEWAKEQDVDVISLSLGTPCISGETFYVDDYIEPIRNAESHGTVVVAAIGNDGEGCTSSPGNTYDAIGVGATDEDGSVASFSGGEVIDTESAWGHRAPASWPSSYVSPDVAAPGVSVKSTYVDGSYRELSGTSMATPHVSGAVALLQSGTPEDLYPAEIKAAIGTSATNPNGDDTDVRYGSGIVDAYGAFDALYGDTSLAGSIIDDVTGEPIPDATVTVTSRDRGHMYEVTSDDEGFFTVDPLLGGDEYEVAVTADGYGTENRTIAVARDESPSVDVSLTGTATASVTVRSAQLNSTITDANVSVETERGSYEAGNHGNGEYVVENVPDVGPQTIRANAKGYDANETELEVEQLDGLQSTITLDGDGTLLVTVSDETVGTAIENAQVTVDRRDTDDSIIEARPTDQNGTVTVTVPGREDVFDIGVEAVGYEAATVSSAPITSGAVESVTVSLSGTATVFGSVSQQATGELVENGTVAATVADRTYTGVTDANGEFVVAGIPAVESAATLTVSHPDYVERTTQTAIEDGESVLVNATLPPRGNSSIQGAITDDRSSTGIDSAVVRAVSTNRSLTYETTTTDDGTFSLDSLVGGSDIEYEITVTADGYNATTGRLTLSGNETVRYDGSIEGTASIAGTVFDELAVGSPSIGNSTVTLVYPEASGTVETRTAADGSFAFDAVPGGDRDVSIVATADGYRNATDVVTVTDGDLITDQRLSLVGSRNLTGVVRDSAANESIENASITATVAVDSLVHSFDGGNATYESKTDTNGTYDLSVPSPQSANLTVSAPGYDSRSIDLAAGTGVESGAIELDGSTAICGSVTEQRSGDPIQNAVVTATAKRDGTPRYEARVADNGSFAFDSVVATGDPYVVTAAARGFESNHTIVASVNETPASSSISIERLERYIGIDVFEAPDSVTIDDTIAFDATLVNLGATNRTELITLMRSGTVVSTKTVDLGVGDQRAISFEDTPAAVEMTNYSIHTANESRSLSVTVSDPGTGGDADDEGSVDAGSDAVQPPGQGQPSIPDSEDGNTESDGGSADEDGAENDSDDGELRTDQWSMNNTETAGAFEIDDRIDSDSAPSTDSDPNAPDAVDPDGGSGAETDSSGDGSVDSPADTVPGFDVVVSLLAFGSFLLIVRSRSRRR